MRKVLGVLAVAFAILLLVPATASAADTAPYPAPPVTAASTVGTATVASSTSDVATTTASTGDALPNTGAGFNIGMTVLVAGVIVVAGVALTIVGARRARRRH